MWILEESLPGVFVVDVLDGAAAFDGTDCEAVGVGETAYDARLPLERAGDGFVDGGWVAEVDHVDVAFGGCDDKQLVFDVHAVDALLSLQCRYGLGTLEVPELDRFVPGPGCDVVFAAGLEPAHAFEAFAVGFGLLGLNLAAGGGGAEVDNVEHTGGVACCYARAVL